MFDENKIIEFVTLYLEECGYVIEGKSGTFEHGYDIIAKRNGRYLYIEAKGQTSSKSYTARYSKEFTHAQKKVHISSAIYKSMRTINEKPGCDIGIALPSSITHKKLVSHVLPSLKKLEIKIFWVDNIGRVTVE